MMRIMLHGTPEEKAKLRQAIAELGHRIRSAPPSRVGGNYLRDEGGVCWSLQRAGFLCHSVRKICRDPMPRRVPRIRSSRADSTSRPYYSAGAPQKTRLNRLEPGGERWEPFQFRGRNRVLQRNRSEAAVQKSRIVPT